MAKGLVVCVVGLLCLLACGVVEGKVSKGSLKAGDFHFLTKFCYGYGMGQLTYNFDTKANVSMAFYDDEGGNWTDVYKHSHLSCAEKLAKSRPPVLITSVEGAGGVRFEDLRRPHFWYMALIACNSSIDVEYEVVMTQESNSSWVKQFSYDEQGLEALYLFYFITFLLFTVVHGYTIWVFMQTSSYHTIVRLLTFSIALEGVSVFCLFVHYAVYAHDGVGAPGLKGIGDLMDIAAQIVFMLLVILIAKGWCITKTTIDEPKLVLIGLGVVIITYLAMFIWVNVGLDPASTLYVYQTAPGIVILVVRSLIMLFFAYCIRTTFLEENNPAKRKFFFAFGISYIVWFISLPFVAAIAAGLDPWVRQKVVMSLYVTFNFIFLSLLGFLLWPSRAHEYFQIGTRDIGSMPYDTI